MRLCMPSNSISTGVLVDLPFFFSADSASFLLAFPALSSVTFVFRRFACHYRTRLLYEGRGDILAQRNHVWSNARGKAEVELHRVVEWIVFARTEEIQIAPSGSNAGELSMLTSSVTS